MKILTTPFSSFAINLPPLFYIFIKVMISFIFSFLILKVFVSVVSIKDFWVPSTRVFALWDVLITLCQKILENKIISPFFILLLRGTIIFNLIRRIPLNALPSLHYCFTLTLSSLLWVRILGCVIKTQLKAFLSHLLPYGSPISLSLFLPIVEIFSHLIRPLTLIVRFSTNLSSGHILLYIFSYFAILRGNSLIYIPLLMLILLEYCVVLIQSYIFVSLIRIYMAETY